MDLIIFDLDGTLIDSKLDLANAVNATRLHMGMTLLDLSTVSSYVGNGAPVLVKRAMGPQASEAQVEEAIEFFLEYYRDHALDETKLYPGVETALARLSDAGKRLAVLTNKPIKMTRSIVAGLGIAARFFQLYGGNSFDFKKPHPIGVETLIAESGVPRERTLMVGDSAVDMNTAVNARVRSCGVTYGFQPETLNDPKPDWLVDRLQDLVPLVLQG